MCTQNLAQKPSFEETYEISRPKWETFEQAAHEVVNWIQRAQGSVQRVELVDILQNLRVP